MPEMDGDHTAKSFEHGANSAMKGGYDMTEGVPESATKPPPAGEKTSGAGTSIFDKSGTLGKHFTPEGTIGGTAQKVGGPLDKDGMIGKHFKPDGAIGATAQSLADKNQK